MKQTLIIAIAMASITAFAQTETTPAATPAAKATEAAPAPAKKAVKKAKKKAAKPSALAPATATPVAKTETLAPAAVTTAAQGTATTAAPAAGTSTATAAAQAAPTKKWGASFVAQAVTNSDLVQKQAKDVKVESINYLAATYKVGADTKLGVRQYFSYNYTPDEVAKGNAQWTIATVGTKFKGIAGSDDISPLFWYYMPTTQALRNVYTPTSGDIEHHYGILRMDAEIAWTLNPRWQVSYYLNPRQSIVNKQNYQDADNNTKIIESTTTLIHQGYVYYNVSDVTQYYATAGMDNRMTTGNLTSIKDHAILAVGAAWTFFNGKFIFNPEIGNEVALKDNGEYASAPKWLQSEDITYTLTGVLAF